MRELPALVRTAYPDSILGRLAAAFGESWQTSRLRALFVWLLTRPYLYLTSGVHGLLERLNLRLAECDRLYASIRSSRLARIWARICRVGRESRLLGAVFSEGFGGVLILILALYTPIDYLLRDVSPSP